MSQFFQGPASQNTISVLGRDLLYDLEFQRRDAPDRPLIFLVHSLGGLVLKDVGFENPPCLDVTLNKQ